MAPNYWLLSPLALTLLPLLYSAPALKSRPQLRTGLFALVVGGGLLHGFSLILGSGAKADLSEEALVRVPAPLRPRAMRTRT